MKFASAYAALSNADAYRADALAMKAGVSGSELMEAAGKGIAETLTEIMPASRVAVLAGPGNNGGDGFVAARYLVQAGFEVDVFLLGQRKALKGDAKAAAEQWGGPLKPISGTGLDVYDCIMDALFGAGLARPLAGLAAAAVRAANQSDAFRLAVDIPSGISGDTGQEQGEAFDAHMTVTFFRKKLGHLLMPGLLRAGEVRVVQIGIPESVMKAMAGTVHENHPDHWWRELPTLGPAYHKYDRGHLAVVGGPLVMSGAARLAARAGLRAGAGLVTTIVPDDAVMAYVCHQTSVMTRPFSSEADFKKAVLEKKISGIVIGPGNGVGEETRDRIHFLLDKKSPLVMDADALTSFEGEPQRLFEKLHDRVVLTPHIGEFRRLWPELDPVGERLKAARQAAGEAGCIVLLKGPDTVIAAPDGQLIVNTNAPPSLATAGSGDVLAGILGGLMAAGMEAFAASAAAAWLHGEAANTLGPGLIAEDIVEAIPGALDSLQLF
ncbi:MAG: NAD(P)H-hydrate dehydratase [Sphingomonadales bacterium]